MSQNVKEALRIYMDVQNSMDRAEGELEAAVLAACKLDAVPEEDLEVIVAGVADDGNLGAVITLIGGDVRPHVDVHFHTAVD